ncbi:MAG: tripartite tricarboxylate transporter TctB family protein [Deltaproteobacteria bacterium]
MRKADITVALLFMAIGLILLFDAVRLGFQWGVTGPESGLFPFYLGLGLVVCSLLTLRTIHAKYKKDGYDMLLMPAGALKPILWVLIPSVGMVVITEFVGLHVAAGIFLGFYMRTVGKIGWVTTLLVSFLVPLSLYISFDKLFLVPLPQGLWGSILIPF